MSERLQILKLLEEGTINAQEAERLLEAILHSRSKDKKAKYRIWSSLEDIPRVISAAIGNAVDETEPGAYMQYDAKKKLVFKGISGDLEINGTTTEKISIEKDGFVKVKEHDDELVIKALSGDVRISAPHNTDISIAGISGDICLTDIRGTLHIESVSGDITGKILSGGLTGAFVSGDVDLDYENIEDIKIKAQSGDVTLRLNEKVKAKLDIESEVGKITCDLELQDRVEKGNLLSGVINEPDANISIKTKHGDVLVTKRS